MPGIKLFFTTLLLVSCSATPYHRHQNVKLNSQGRQFEQGIDQYGSDMENIVENAFNIANGVLSSFPSLVLPKIFPSATSLIVETRSKSYGQPNITSTRTSYPVLQQQISSVRPNLPIPVIPNFSPVVAPFDTIDHQILGLLPKSKGINSNWWVDDIQIPEDVHLVMTPPQPVKMPNDFQVLVFMDKSKPVDANLRILNYNFPPLRFLAADGGGYFNPINSHLVAVPFIEFIQSKYLFYLVLGLLPNSHPLSYALSTNPSIPIPMIRQPISPPIPLNPLPTPVIASSPLPPSDGVSALIRSLNEFTLKYPETLLFQLPDNLEMVAVHPNNIIGLLGQVYPLILVPKSWPPSPNHLILKGPTNHDEGHQLWTDFQLVAKMDADPFTPSFFHPLALVSTQHSNLSDNEAPLPIGFINTNAAGVEFLKIVVIRDPQQTPIHPYKLLCLAPKTYPEKASAKINSSTTDDPENAAIHPRVIAESTTTRLPSTTAFKEIRWNQPTLTVSESEKKAKPLPSKKSWKNRLSSYGVDMEPSVKVVKREPTTGHSSIFFSLFGL